MKFKKINQDQKKLYEHIVKEIKEKIIKGELQPEDKLPSERKLADLFGVSRTTVRRGINTLEALGIIKVIHGKGIFISNNIDVKLVKNIKSFNFDDKSHIGNLFEVRKTLESKAAYLAAQRRKNEELEHLEVEMKKFEKKVIEYNDKKITSDEIEAHNRKVHIIIISMSNNPILVRLMNNLNELIKEIYDYTTKIDSRIEQSFKEHKAIYKAIKNKEAEEASEKMLEHLRGVEFEIREE